MQKTNIDFLTKTILSCTSQDNHETMNDWLERLFRKNIIDSKSYERLLELNSFLLSEKRIN